MIKRAIILLSCVALLGAATAASAAISAADADRLGKDLTPMGAEKAGNADGTIPEWTGGLTGALPGWPNKNNYRPNPHADDKVLFTITKDNMAQYADKLTDGTKAMLEAYPDFFKMNVYPSRRTAAYPQELYDSIKKQATSAKLVDDGNSVEGAWGAIPFPIPQNGNEVVWNHLLRYRGVAMEAKTGENIVYVNGSRIDLEHDTFIYHPYHDPNVSEQDRKEGAIWKYATTVTAPSRDAGEGTLAIDNIAPSKISRKAWVYFPDQRRVRRAPNLAFDQPDRPLNVIDDFGIYSGSPERYDWKLVGKKEMYIPYNNNEVNSPNRKVKETLVAGFIPADVLRYELHRVWVVEGTVKEGKRHAYAKRVFYVDEDTWIIVATDKYDGSGNLWRVAYFYPVVAAEIPLTGAGPGMHFDVKTNGYYIFPHTIGKGRVGWNFNVEAPPASYYTPAAVRRRGR